MIDAGRMAQWAKGFVAGGMLARTWCMICRSFLSTYMMPLFRFWGQMNRLNETVNLGIKSFCSRVPPCSLSKTQWDHTLGLTHLKIDLPFPQPRWQHTAPVSDTPFSCWLSDSLQHQWPWLMHAKIQTVAYFGERGCYIWAWNMKLF